jgi:imidazoleglycerol phosphate synthase glutamine amidotransferase subunit HisH
MARELTLVDALGSVASVERALLQVGAAVQVTSDPDVVARSRRVVLPGQSAFGAGTRAIVDGAMGAALRMVIERGDPFLGICLGMQLLFDGSEENGGQEGLHVLSGYCRRFPDDMTIADESARQSQSTESSQQPASPASSSTTSPTANEILSTPTDEIADIFDLDSPAPPPPEPRIQPMAPEPESPPPLRRRLKVPHVGWNEVEPTGEHYYFVHSYYVEPQNPEDVLQMTTYGGIRFASVVQRQNVLACQFHPDKSQVAGLKFLRAFVLDAWR